MKLDPGMHIGVHLVFFGKSGVTLSVLTDTLASTAYFHLHRLAAAFKQAVQVHVGATSPGVDLTNLPPPGLRH
jgi:hypothetical protein